MLRLIFTAFWSWWRHSALQSSSQSEPVRFSRFCARSEELKVTAALMIWSEPERTIPSQDPVCTLHKYSQWKVTEYFYCNCESYSKDQKLLNPIRLLIIYNLIGGFEAFLKVCRQKIWCRKDFCRVSIWVFHHLTLLHQRLTRAQAVWAIILIDQ